MSLQSLSPNIVEILTALYGITAPAPRHSAEWAQRSQIEVVTPDQMRWQVTLYSKREVPILELPPLTGRVRKGGNSTDGYVVIWIEHDFAITFVKVKEVAPPPAVDDEEDDLDKLLREIDFDDEEKEPPPDILDEINEELDGVERGSEPLREMFKNFRRR